MHKKLARVETCDTISHILTLFCSVLGGDPVHGGHNLRVLAPGLEQLPRLVSRALVPAQLVYTKCRQ